MNVLQQGLAKAVVKESRMADLGVEGAMHFVWSNEFHRPAEAL